VSHPDVDLVSFIGGLVTGKPVAAAAAATVKKVALELGGKNPNVIFADARFDAAVDNALNAAFVNSGQVCSAGARLIVAEELHDRFVDEMVRRARNIRLGGPFDDKAQTGPLIAPPSRTAESQSPNHVPARTARASAFGGGRSWAAMPARAPYARDCGANPSSHTARRGSSPCRPCPPACTASRSPWSPRAAGSSKVP